MPPTSSSSAMNGPARGRCRNSIKRPADASSGRGWKITAASSRMARRTPACATFEASQRSSVTGTAASTSSGAAPRRRASAVASSATASGGHSSASRAIARKPAALQSPASTIASSGKRCTRSGRAMGRSETVTPASRAASTP